MLHFKSSVLSVLDLTLEYVKNVFSVSCKSSCYSNTLPIVNLESVAVSTLYFIVRGP